MKRDKKVDPSFAKAMEGRRGGLRKGGGDYAALSGREYVVVGFFPGRCPGLSYSGPSGRRKHGWFDISTLLSTSRLTAGGVDERQGGNYAAPAGRKILLRLFLPRVLPWAKLFWPFGPKFFTQGRCSGLGYIGPLGRRFDTSTSSVQADTESQPRAAVLHNNFDVGSE
jgi:hypothetical protein